MKAMHICSKQSFTGILHRINAELYLEQIFEHLRNCYKRPVIQCLLVGNIRTHAAAGCASCCGALSLCGCCDPLLYFDKVLAVIGGLNQMSETIATGRNSW